MNKLDPNFITYADNEKKYQGFSPEILDVLYECENKKLEDVLLSLRNEYINQGGDPNQLEIFDVNHSTQLKIFESPDGGKTIYEREAGDYENMRKKISE